MLTADHRIDLAGAGAGRQVDAVFTERRFAIALLAHGAAGLAGDGAGQPRAVMRPFLVLGRARNDVGQAVVEAISGNLLELQRNTQQHAA